MENADLFETLYISFTLIFRITTSSVVQVKGVVKKQIQEELEFMSSNPHGVNDKLSQQLQTAINSHKHATERPPLTRTEARDLLKKFEKLEKETKKKYATAEAMNYLFDKLDDDGSGFLEIDEVYNACQEHFPLLNSIPALMKAFKACLPDRNGEVVLNTSGMISACVGDAWVARHEFVDFFTSLQYFNRIYQILSINDTKPGLEVDFNEFQQALKAVGYKSNEVVLMAEFERLISGNDVINIESVEKTSEGTKTNVNSFGVDSNKRIDFDVMCQWYIFVGV